MRIMENVKKLDDISKKLPEIQALLQDMVAELRFRGCDENHKLFYSDDAGGKNGKKSPSFGPG